MKIACRIDSKLEPDSVSEINTEDSPQDDYLGSYPYLKIALKFGLPYRESPALGEYVEQRSFDKPRNRITIPNHEQYRAILHLAQRQDLSVARQVKGQLMKAVRHFKEQKKGLRDINGIPIPTPNTEEHDG